MSKSINQTPSEAVTINTKLTQELINKPQQPYLRSGKYEKTPVQDTVQIGGKESEKKWYQKYKKHLIAAGVGLATIAAVVLGKQKLDANKIKKAEAEARRLAEEARQKAREAEEKARKEAEEKLQAQRKAEAEARQKAKLEAEAKAKAEAEEKARIEAEKAKEAERIAKEKIINAMSKGKDEISEIIGLYSKDNKSKYSKYYNADGTVNFETVLNPENLVRVIDGAEFDSSYYFLDNIHRQVNELSESDVSQKIIDMIKKMETSGLNYEQIKEVLSGVKKVSESDIGLLRKASESLEIRSFDTECRLRANNEKIDYINKRLSHEKPMDGETSADFVSRIIKDFEDKKAIEKQEHLRSVHSKITYTDEPCIEYFADDPNYRGPNVWAAEKYSSSETSGYTDNADFIKKFSTFPRYRGYAKGEIAEEYNGVQPLVRWIRTPSKFFDEVDPVTGDRPIRVGGFRTSNDFVERFQVGKEYSVPIRQSCSKSFNTTYGDADFCDYATDKDIKMIFVPKSKNASRAVDLLDNGYKGHNGEAIYLPGEKFVVLDKRIEEVVNPHAEPGSRYRSFYRWVIELQEK